MSLNVHVDTENVRIPVSRARVAATAACVLRAERIASAEVSVSFVTNRRMAAINRKHLGHGGATDVISFALPSSVLGAPLAGDIYIAPDVARVNAAAHDASLREELLRLVVHGTLHVIGHDHPVDEGREQSLMWRRQEALLQRAMAGE